MIKEKFLLFADYSDFESASISGHLTVYLFDKKQKKCFFCFLINTEFMDSVCNQIRNDILHSHLLVNTILLKNFKSKTIFNAFNFVIEYNAALRELVELEFLTLEKLVHEKYQIVDDE